MLKVMLYMVGTFRTSSLGDSISSNPERTELRRRWEKSGYVEVLQQRAGNLNIKRLLLTKENQISKIKEFSTFLCMGIFKSLAHSPHMHLSYLGLVSCVFQILSSLWAHCIAWLQSWWLTDHRHSSFLSAFRAYFGGLESLMTVASLFIDEKWNTFYYISKQGYHNHQWFQLSDA